MTILHYRQVWWFLAVCITKLIIWNSIALAGVIDNSGIRFSYTNIPPEQQAGLITLAAPTNPSVIIPPGSPNFTITAFCSRECTQAVS